MDSLKDVERKQTKARVLLVCYLAILWVERNKTVVLCPAFDTCVDLVGCCLVFVLLPVVLTGVLLGEIDGLPW